MFSVTAWGTSFLVSQDLMTVLTPVQLMWLRFVIAYAAMWVVCHKWSFSWSKEWPVLILSLVGNTLYYLAENTALQITQASNVSILVSTAPLISLLITRVFQHDTALPKKQVLGVIIAFAGVFLVVFNGVFVLKLRPLGDLLALSASLLWAVYGYVAKWALGRFDNDSALLTRKLMFYGILTSIPLLLGEGASLGVLTLLTAQNICGLLYLGLICSALCYLLWNSAIEQLGALKTNLYVYVVPLVTLIASVIFLKEQITAGGLAGIVLVILGMILSSL